MKMKVMNLVYLRSSYGDACYVIYMLFQNRSMKCFLIIASHVKG